MTMSRRPGLGGFLGRPGAGEGDGPELLGCPGHDGERRLIPCAEVEQDQVAGQDGADSCRQVYPPDCRWPGVGDHERVLVPGRLMGVRERGRVYDGGRGGRPQQLVAGSVRGWSGRRRCSRLSRWHSRSRPALGELDVCVGRACRRVGRRREGGHGDQVPVVVCPREAAPGQNEAVSRPAAHPACQQDGLRRPVVVLTEGGVRMERDRDVRLPGEGHRRIDLEGLRGDTGGCRA